MQAKSVERVVVIEAGRDVVEALAGEPLVVAGSGLVESVQLRLVTDAVDVVRNVRGRAMLCALSKLGERVCAVLSRATDVGIETIAGELVAARSLGVTLVAARAQAAPQPHESTAKRLAPVAPSSPSTTEARAQAPTWADVAAVQPAPDVDGPPEIAPGDLVDHASFGWCEVLVRDGGRIRVRDLHGPGRIRDIALDVFEVLAAPPRGDKRCFRLIRSSK